MKRLELLLTTCLVLLKLAVLYGTWGRTQGFDGLPWLEVFRATHWFRPLPGPREFFASYHPPLSYLACRLIYAIYPHEVQASQLLSTMAILGAVFALRSTLRTMGVLWTLPGLAMLYVTASIPLLVWLSIETNNDALAFMWFALTLALSVKLFWVPTPAGFWRRPRYAVTVLLLGLALAGGLLTKFNAFLFFALPPLVIVARHGLMPSRREVGAALVSISLGALLSAPIYYTRYYRTFGHVFPQAIEWERPDDLKAAVRLRDANQWRFLLHMIRVPEAPFTGTNVPVGDSFIHSIWLQTWRRDAGLGRQGRLSAGVSDLYQRTFSIIVGGSTLLFFLARRRLPAAWRDLGWVLLPVSVMFAVALLRFAWQYPLWDWEIFKAKYVSAAVLWIPYSVALLVVGVTSLSAILGVPKRFTADAILLVVVLFMFVNHLLPVY